MSGNMNGQFPAGWYPDQTSPGMQRYWDGVQWTRHTQPTAPVPPPPMPAPVAPPTTAPVAAPTTVPVPRTQQQYPVGPGGVPLPFDAAGAARAEKRGRNTAQIVAASVALVLVLGFMAIIISSIVRGAGDADLASDSGPAPTTSAIPEPSPTEAVATPTPEPTEDAQTINAEHFRTTAAGDIADLNKDLDDMLVAVDEAGVFRIVGNSVEISFNYGQLSANAPPGSIETEWAAALVVLEQQIAVMDDAITADNYDSIRAAVGGIRAQLVVMSEIIPRAV